MALLCYNGAVFSAEVTGEKIYALHTCWFYMFPKLSIVYQHTIFLCFKKKTKPLIPRESGL